MPAKQPKRLPSDLPRPKVLRAIRRMGFHFVREGADHTVFGDVRNPELTMSIPRHARINRNLLRGILRRAGVTEDEFMEQY